MNPLTALDNRGCCPQANTKGLKEFLALAPSARSRCSFRGPSSGARSSCQLSLTQQFSAQPKLAPMMPLERHADALKSCSDLNR